MALLGTAYVARVQLGARPAYAIAAVGACYIALAACSLVVLGFDANGVLGAAGMLVPASVAGGLTMLPR